jgi:hypothetical protein
LTDDIPKYNIVYHSRYTSRKKGFHLPPLVPKLFGPQPKGALVPVQLKMWARGH